MSNRQLGMGGHQSAAFESDVWLTPPAILDAIGPFDLDPCAAPEPRPWPTAALHFTRKDDGLRLAWRVPDVAYPLVWMNPPYGGPSTIGPWMRKLVDHGSGVALIFARTETEVFHETVWERATAVLFLRGRLFFHHADGRRAAHNAGAPSCLVAYGDAGAERLRRSGLDGHLVNLGNGMPGAPSLFAGAAA